MARTVLPFVGAAVGFWIGGPTGAQVGFALGGVVGNAVDPVKNIGPRIGETGAQTSAEGAPRAIVYGTVAVTGNVIVAGALIKGDFEEGGKGGPVNVTERCFRTYAIRICEGPISGVLRIWENDKLVADFRSESLIVDATEKWMFGNGIYLGDETQMPDGFLTINTYADNPAYRGTAYMVFVFRDLTDFRGAIPQYRFEVASEIRAAGIGDLTATAALPGVAYYAGAIFRDEAGELGYGYWTAAPTWAGANPYHIRKYANDFTVLSDVTYALGGAHSGSVYPRGYSDTRMLAVDDGGGSVGDTYGACLLVEHGTLNATLAPSGQPVGWWSITGSAPWEGDGKRVWISSEYVYVGTIYRNLTAYNNLGVWPVGAMGAGAAPIRLISGICATPGLDFFTHLGRDGKLRVINDVLTLSVYSELLILESTQTIPFGGFNGFGIDGDVAVFSFTSPTARLEVRKVSDWSLVKTIPNAVFSVGGATRVIFTNDSCYVQCGLGIARLAYSFSSVDGLPTTVGAIVADIHYRCGVDASQFDVSELTDEVDGLVLAGEYAGADAINTLRGPYFFDKAEYDLKLWYPKRGAAVVDTLTIDDLIDEPDTQMREQAIEYARKFHLFYQHAASGYAVVKATSQRSSPDVQVVGEVTVQVPVVFVGAEDEAAQTVAKMHKVSWAEAEGEVKFSVPWSFLKLVPSNNIGLSLRGRVNRLRLTQLDLHDGVIDVTARHDRQSAYTSNVTGIPIPTPTPPPDTIVGDTTLLVLDIPSLRDNEDDLNIYYAVTGAQPAWYGSVVQRSLDGGATWTNVVQIDRAARIGELTVAVPDASADYTDTTNSVHIRLYRESQTLESISTTSFLSEGGAFALENADGSWEIMQARDWHEDSSGNFVGTTLHRGRLNTTTNSHAIGRRFVMLEDVTHVQAQSSMIGQTVTHRAPSLSQASELAAEQSLVYTGASQIEWPVASLVLSRTGDTVTGSWAPRYRFGTDDAPVNSANMTGFRVAIVGTGTITFDTTSPSFSQDVSTIGGSVTVSVSALNRITGQGPTTSGTI